MRDKPTDDYPAARAKSTNNDSSAHRWATLGDCPAASAVLSESVNIHFIGPSRSGHVKVGRDTWAWAKCLGLGGSETTSTWIVAVSRT